MPSLEIPEGFGQVTFTMEIPGNAGPAIVVHGFQDDPGLTLFDVAEFWDERWDNDIMIPLSDSVTHTLTTIQVMRGGVLQFSGAVSTVTGGDPDPVAPPQVTYLAQKFTALVGRQFRGRMYLPGVVENAVDSGGAVSDGKRGNLNIQFSDYLAEAVVASMPMMILHSDPLTPPTEVGALLCAPLVATQRRRLR